MPVDQSLTASVQSAIPGSSTALIAQLQGGHGATPGQAKGIGGFVFDYVGESEAELTAEITDHWLEDNTAIQDHVARKPIRFVLHGFVGELVFSQDAGIVGIIAGIQQKLSTLPAYLGKYTPQAAQTVNAALTKASNVMNQVDQAMGRAKNILGLLPGATVAATNQQKAYKQLCALGGFQTNAAPPNSPPTIPGPTSSSQQIVQTNPFATPANASTQQLNPFAESTSFQQTPPPPIIPTPFTVVTPWGSYDNMLIEHVRLIQPEGTFGWSDIAVTIKQVRFTQIQYGNLANQGRRATSAESQSVSSPTLGVPVSLSTPVSFFN